MTRAEYINLLQKPETADSQHIADLRSMLESYPYLVSARVLLAKALKKSNSVQFMSTASQSALYVESKRWFYFFIYPEKMKQEYLSMPISKVSAGDYFDMMGKIESEGGDTRQSLRQLAEKLKAVREEYSTFQNQKKTEVKHLIINKINEDESFEKLEEKAKKLISERKFNEAIEILKQLNFNNPKKSIYFADQIRFLEKII